MINRYKMHTNCFVGANQKQSDIGKRISKKESMIPYIILVQNNYLNSQPFKIPATSLRAISRYIGHGVYYREC